MSKKIDNLSAENCEKIKETIKLCYDKKDSYCLNVAFKVLKIYCDREYLYKYNPYIMNNPKKNTLFDERDTLEPDQTLYNNYINDIMQILPPI